MQRVIIALLAVITVQMGAIGFYCVRKNIEPEFNSQYQAVVLNGGQVYFGKLERANSQYPVLRDVFYIVNQLNPETKQQANVLVRRGKELHGPAFMVLNRDSIFFIEPVKEDSQIAKFIAEQNNPR
jgi:hypothetical protein